MGAGTFLLVDDNPDNLFSLEQVLLSELPDAEIVRTTRPEEALALAREKAVDVALVDLKMPGMDGLESCRRLKADESASRFPVVLVTAHETAPALRAAGLDAGPDDFLSRPIDRAELIAKIRAMLRIKNAEDELRHINARLEQRVFARTRALQESEDRFRRAVTDAPVPIMMHAEDGEVLQVNRVWTKLTGYTLGDLPTVAAWVEQACLLKPFDEPVAPRDRSAPKAQALDGETTIRTKTGEERIWDIRSSPIGGLPDGRHLVVTMAADVTALKQVEASLRRENAKLGTMLSAVDGGVIFVDADNVVVEVNDWLLRLIGQPRQIVVGRLLVDGTRGTVTVRPDNMTDEHFTRRIGRHAARSADACRCCREPARTLDGLLVRVEANICSLEDACAAAANGADGIGLYRIEGLYLSRRHPPSEEELLACLRDTLQPLGDKAVTIRLLDAGGDKPLSFARFAPEPDPALGRRGVRLLLECPELLNTQLRALLRLARDRPVRILVPMVALAEEMLEVRRVLHATARDLGAGGPPAARRDDRDPRRGALRPPDRSTRQFPQRRNERPDPVHHGRRPRERPRQPVLH